jgi:23S rRNA (guanosine2251-2'-O)-methyltransferase
MSRKRPPASRPEGARPEKRSHDSRGHSAGQILWGVHPVEAALSNPKRRLIRLTATKSGFERVSAAAGKRGVSVSLVEDDALARRLPREAVHQGLMLEAHPLDQPALEDVLADTKPGTRLFLVLDQITDPHNLGAILRSAAAFGVTAVIVQDRHSPQATGVVAKSASGALDRVALTDVVNIARTLDLLKREGFQVFGLDDEGAYDIAGADLTGDVALVMGTEGDGLRRLVREACDKLLRLPTMPRMPSLNVSNATAVTLYEAARQRGR